MQNSDSFYIILLKSFKYSIKLFNFFKIYQTPNPIHFLKILKVRNYSLTFWCIVVTPALVSLICYLYIHLQPLLHKYFILLYFSRICGLLKTSILYNEANFQYFWELILPTHIKYVFTYALQIFNMHALVYIIAHQGAFKSFNFFLSYNFHFDNFNRLFK